MMASKKVLEIIDSTVLSVTVKLKGKISKTLVQNAVRQFRLTDRWYDVYEIVTEAVADDIPRGIDEKFEKVAKVKVCKANGTESFNPCPYDMIKLVHEFDKNLKHVTIEIEYEDISKTDALKDHGTRSAFDVLMKAAVEMKRPPPIPTDKARYSAKDRLYNDVLNDMNDIKFPAHMIAADVKQQMMIIIDALWYIDAHHMKINGKSTNKIPERFEKYNGYDDFKKKRKAPPSLSANELKRHSSLLFRLSSSTYASQWTNTASELQKLSICLQTYAAYLDESNVQQKFRQSLSHPVRQVGTHSVVRNLPSTDKPVEKYFILEQVLKESEEYTPIYFDEQLHIKEPFSNKMQKVRFVAEMTFPFAVDVLEYDPGSGLGKVIFLWRAPDDRSTTEMISSATRIHKILEGRLPEYHTQEMRREFKKTYQRFVHIPDYILRAMYSDLTLDATASQNPSIDARLRQAILSEDYDMVIDMRTLNKGRPDDTFDVFFKKLDEEVSTVTAADERRHGDVAHFSKYISVRDLIEQTAKKCPDGTPIPSESTVLFAFVPKNSYVETAKLYKGRINLQHKVQSRQLRASHVDEHYCAAIFLNMREYSVMNRDETCFICLDDKAKIDYGEPGLAISSGVRGKKSIVPVSTALCALDHDVASKGSLTPSVALVVDIPESGSRTDTFYRGQVYVTLKDSVFQPSTPFRHAAELYKILDGNTKPILMLYTDGGPDHRTTYGAVKLSLIILFKLLDLDILIAARTAPGHSWANPAERIMSLLNLAYQNIALHRSEMSSHFEQLLRSCNSMTDIRKKAERERGLEEAWIQSLESITNQLNDRTSRVQLKGKPFMPCEPASKENIQGYESKVFDFIDPNMTLGKYTQADLRKVNGFKSFVEKHCVERNYIFQVRKCEDLGCCRPVRNSSGELPPFLPDPVINPDDPQHYKKFHDVIGTNTTEEDMPSRINMPLARVAEEHQGCPNRILVAQNVRKTVTCLECKKPRCIYSRKHLTAREERSLTRVLERYMYTCGSLITPDGDSLQGTVFVRLQLACTTPVEIAYYSANAVARKDVCCFCASSVDIIDDQDLLRKYRVVLPMCRECKSRGKNHICRLPKKN